MVELAVAGGGCSHGVVTLKTPHVHNPSHACSWRFGDGAPPAALGAPLPYFLEEWSIGGDATSASVARTIAMPTTGQNACTGSNTTTWEGGGSLSWDGKYLVTQCFTAPVGTLSAAQSNPLYPQRQINRFRADGVVHHIRYTDISTGNVRGVATFNGTDFWGLAGGGVRLIRNNLTSLDSAPSGTVVNASFTPSLFSTTVTQWRGISFAADTPDAPQLFAIFSANPSNCGLFALGAGLPTATMTSALQLNCTTAVPGGMQTSTSFFFQDANTLWVSGALALYKFTAGPRTGPTPRLVGSTWALAPGYPVNQSNGECGGRPWGGGQDRAGARWRWRWRVARLTCPVPPNQPPLPPVHAAPHTLQAAACGTSAAGRRAPSTSSTA
jgi:hypothetical protein